MWNAKVRCVDDSGGGFKLGNIYEVKNGVINYEDGEECGLNFDSLYELNNKFMSKFELVHEELQQPHKSLLEDGDYVVARNGIEGILSLKYGKLFLQNSTTLFIEGYDEYLYMNSRFLNKYDVMEIYRDGKLIAKRTEKTPQQLEIESIESEIKRETEEHNDKMKKLADRLGELGKEIMR